MGAITSNFDLLPADADTNRVALYTKVYEDLTSLSLALPAQPANTITRAQLQDHLRALVGELVKTELQGDPEDLEYGGAADAVQRGVLCDPQPERVRSALARYTIAGALSTTVLTTAEGGLNLLGFPGGWRIRFARTTTTVALRGVAGVVVSTTATALTLQSALPATPVLGDRFRLFDASDRRARINELLVKIPHAPNALTAADITAAKV